MKLLKILLWTQAVKDIMIHTETQNKVILEKSETFYNSVF